MLRRKIPRSPNFVHSPLPKWILDKADWPLLTDVTATTDSAPPPPPPTDTIEHDVSTFTDFIVQTKDSSLNPIRESFLGDLLTSKLTSQLAIKTYRFQKFNDQKDAIHFKKFGARTKALLHCSK